MKTKKLVIFGNGVMAQLANYYFNIDSEYEVVAFIVDRKYLVAPLFEDKPVIAFDAMEDNFSKNDVEVFIGLSYSNMNRDRAAKFYEVKEKGYKVTSYISSKCSYLSQFEPGENVFIFEDNTIQPFVKIGDNVILWSGNHIGHHSTIHAHNFVSSHVVISGFCVINSFCFLGVNATLAHKITLASGTLLGAGVVITKDTEENSVYVPPRPTKLDKTSNNFRL